jgi:polysaccharide biosynthesis/export protein
MFMRPLTLEFSASYYIMRKITLVCMFCLGFGLTACSNLPSSGPLVKDIKGAKSNIPEGIQVVEIDQAVIRQLNQPKPSNSFATNYSSTSSALNAFGIGDVIEVSIWEAPPATLFAADSISRFGSVGGAKGTTLPEQTIGKEGHINVPFVGSVAVLGRSPTQIEQEIMQRLRGKAHQPQAIVRQIRQNASLVTVVGEVTNNMRMPLTQRGERVLDAIASAGGSKHPVHKTTVQLSRGSTTVAMPLDHLIREPQHNVALQAADIITVIHQPKSFTSLGATGKNDEISFEAQGISLAQALARVGGLQDNRADAQGVFVFRFAPSLTGENASAMLPTIYRLDLKTAAGYFLAQSFLMENKDVLYVSNASGAELQKFANLIYTIALPAISTVNSLR